MARIVAFTAISLTIAVVVSSELSFSRAQEEHEERCGTVHKLRLAPLTGPRFLQIADYDGRSFVDMQTCLVARLEVFSEPVTLADAMQRCATLGQGGPRGHMGWQLPTAAELTSLDGEEWLTRSNWKSAPPAPRRGIGKSRDCSRPIARGGCERE
jgi:hypothetical protein